MAGIDSNAKLVLHMNGTDGSVNFPDASSFSHSPVAIANAQVDTAQSQFGGASGLFDGSGDYVSIPDSTDWDFGTSDMALDCWVRFSTLAGNQCIVGRPTSGSNYFYWALEGGGIRFRDFNGSNVINFNWSASALVINTWHHLAVTRTGSTFRFFVDGVLQNSGSSGASFTNRATDLQVGGNSSINYWMNGWMDEVRVSIGDSRWTANFTPPTSEYTSDDIIVIPSALTINSSIESVQNIIDTSFIPQPLDINSDLQTPLVGQVVVVTPNSLDIVSSLETPTSISNVSITPEILSISSSIEAPFFPVIGSQISKIISVNPLIAVTDTSPVQIIKIDITDPENLIYESTTIPNINNAKDFSVNSFNDFVFVTGDNGKIVKVEIANLTNQTTIDVSDTDNIITIDTNPNFGVTYAGTDNNVGELYAIDERSTFTLDSDLTVIAPLQFTFESDFNIVNSFKLDSDFQLLAEQTFAMNSDFKCLDLIIAPVFPPEPPDPLPPPAPSPVVNIDDIDAVNLTDYQVFIDNVELQDTDLILNSIAINHGVDQESRASFRLTRKHDQLNKTVNGDTVNITSQNEVVIKVKGITIFPFKGIGIGRISELDARYNANGEFVQVNALSEEAVNQLNEITMSLPSLDSRLSLYDILVQNPKIANPYVDPANETNPKKFKGIRVDLGKKITQKISAFRISDTGQPANIFNDEAQIGKFAQSIIDGTFNPIPNWTYFWSTDVYKFGKVELGETAGILFDYIGTSLSPVSEDLWLLVNAPHWRQRIFENDEEELGIYEVGEAPFKTISVRNGRLITKPKYKDEPSLLVSVKEKSYNFEEYAKRVADLELKKIQNINGDILPDTSCSLNCTIDAFLYYDISLLTRIKVDNTTTTDIYTVNNGFPVSVKSITINSSNRQVVIQADNNKSNKELEDIDGQFPDEDDDEYNEEERRVNIAGKSNMRTRLEIE